MKKTSAKFDEYFSEHKKILKLYEEKKINENEYDDLAEMMLVLSDVQARLFLLRKTFYRDFCLKFPNNYWPWYFRSSFLRYETGFKKKAYECASEAVSLLAKKNDYVGAISRNFITLAMEYNDYDVIDEEIERLNSNPNKESQILYGVVDDIYAVLNEGSLKPSSMKILQWYFDDNSHNSPEK